MENETSTDWDANTVTPRDGERFLETLVGRNLNLSCYPFVPDHCEPGQSRGHYMCDHRRAR